MGIGKCQTESDIDRFIDWAPISLDADVQFPRQRHDSAFGFLIRKSRIILSSSLSCFPFLFVHKGHHETFLHASQLPSRIGLNRNKLPHQLKRSVAQVNVP